MDRTEIKRILGEAETAVAAGDPIGPTGFWGAVGEIKSDVGLVEEFGGRVAGIDQESFRQWALITVPLWAGNTVMIGGTAVGFALIWWAYNLGEVLAGLVFLAGFAIVLSATHGLAHLVVGSLVGIKFVAWFIGTTKRPQPGVKVDYNSYLRTAPRSRAWMHASGALVSKAIPFLLLGAAYGADVPVWVVLVLLVVGFGSIITDVVWSTKSSDWKRYKREMMYA